MNFIEILVVLIIIAALFYQIKHKSAKTKGQQTISPAPAIDPEIPTKATTLQTDLLESIPSTKTQLESTFTANPDWIPEDSALKRHYLSNRAAEKLAITNPYPTDASLRRHYESQLASQLPQVTPANQIAALDDTAEIGLHTTASTIQIESETAEIAAEPLSSISISAEPETSTTSSPIPSLKATIPEDSTLKRHFLTQLQASISAQLPPKPSDATLKRHYDALVQAKLAEYLQQ
ncbi:hypothetical protein KEF85_13555 [Methylomonas paludis]|uniref:Uncharacterized protein n=1 Tax=Methylomonas paludis TaxID=1173101 RepID=A0A975R9J4_9GAMM|nr:hypothetical protein [Methylomonas paludis]QWF70353.1 hypothetical protein KEF85_13555 [Methylomonas paludis]